MLFEHKSYPARLIHLQMLEYILKIWQLHLKQHGGGEAGQLPIILPLLVYHGNRRWPYDSRLTSLLCGPIDELAAYIPDFRIIITDLTCFSDDEIKGTVLSRVVLLLFKHIFDPDLHSVLPEIFAMFRELEQQPTGLKYLETLLRYLYSAADIAPDELTAIAQETLTGQGGEIAMTTAKQLEQRGYEQGMQQGMREGMLEAIELGLQLKFGVAGERMFSTIAKIQELVRLKAIKNSIPLVNDLSELQPLIEEP